MRTPRSLAGQLPMPLGHVVPITHREPRPVVRRRRRVVGAVAGVGAAMLGVSLASRPGSQRFLLTSLGVAGAWTIGGLASGPLHLGWIQGRDRQLGRPVLTPIATGVGAFGFFVGAAAVATRVPVLDRAIEGVLVFADEGTQPWVLATTLANGVGEEVFFRGALYTSLLDHRPVLASTVVYSCATATTRNPALVLAAGLMGGLFGLQRRASHGLQAPLVTHLTWSTLMVRYFPRIYRRLRAGAVR